MESLFTYDGLYNKINRTFIDAKNQCDRIEALRDTTNKLINEGDKFVEKASGLLVDAENNIQVRRHCTF